VAARAEQLVASVIAGYTMSLQRVERALAQHGLEMIPCESRLFDPERMEVVEAVADSGRPPSEVIDVVRPGYLWRGRVFRYAQVRVARSCSPSRPDSCVPMSEPIVGIDLGTTNSEVALVRDRQPVVFAEDDDPILPSFVALSEDGRLLVGKAARNQWVLAPERTIKSI